MKVNGKSTQTIWLSEDKQNVQIIDQTKLPFEFKVVTLNCFEDAFKAIKNMLVRGAPLIGVTGAYGVFLAAKENKELKFIQDACDYLNSARPTAVNLSWALNRMLQKAFDSKSNNIIENLCNEANKILEEDINFCENIGKYGCEIIKDLYNKKKRPINILTHCNAGWLATVDWGTATSPIYKAFNDKIPIHVWVDETRPRNQGSFLTSWELGEHGVSHTVIADNTGGHLMQNGQVDIVIVGSDRTTFTGDVCNKIGTYLKALSAYDNKIPFYAALPSSTIDWDIEDGKNIPIEERNNEEVSMIRGKNKIGIIEEIQIVPDNTNVKNYAFDVTPSKFVTGIITERGVCAASKASIANLFPEKVKK